MTTFREASLDGTTPSRVVVLPRSAFALDWKDRPVDDAPIGLRLMSERDLRDAHNQAIEYASRVTPDYEARVEAYNEALVRMAVARATTNPNDAQERYFGNMADEEAGRALTQDGMRQLYEQIVLLTIELSPLTPEATEQEVLQALLKLPAAPPGLAARMRRVLGYVVQSLDQIPMPPLDEPEAGEGASAKSG